MGRAPCCDKDGLKKGPWTPEEDQKLLDYIQQHGHGSWRTLPKIAGLARCGKSCRLRWANYLRPDIKRGRFSFEEEEAIIQLHSVLGNKWSAIAARLPGRTDNEIKNYWNTHIRKRLLRMGIDPVTHSPRLDLSPIVASSLCNSNYQLNLSNLIGIEPLINSELIRLATSILSSTSSQLIQTHQNSNLLAQYSQSNQLQNPPQLQNTCYSTLQSSVAHSPDQKQKLALQYSHAVRQMPNNADPFSTSQTVANLGGGSEFNIAQTSHWPAGDITDNIILSSIDYNQIISPMVSNDSYSLSNNAADQIEDIMNAICVKPNNLQPGTSTDHPDLSLIGSVSATTSSSKFMKSSPATYMNGSVSTTPSSTWNNDSTDQDDKDSYVCSTMDLIKFQIPDLLDFDDFIMCPTHTS